MLDSELIGGKVPPGEDVLACASSTTFTLPLSGLSRSGLGNRLVFRA